MELTSLDHDVGDMHPEHPMRIIAINHQLDRLGILQDAYRGGGGQGSRDGGPTGRTVRPVGAVLGLTRLRTVYMAYS